MARKPRFNLMGIPQHVIQRGNNREPCFYAENDYYRCLHDLADAARKNHCAIHAYVLMTNHVHLLVTPFKEHGVSHMMQRENCDPTPLMDPTHALQPHCIFLKTRSI
jgi:putative transposase